MPDSIKDKVKVAIESNVEARAQYNQAMHEMSEKLGYSKIEDRDPNERQILAPPASEQDILKLENFIGISLPPSYRAFLQEHDGWQMIDGSPDFLSISEIFESMTSKEHTELIENAMIRGDDFVKNSLVIGASKEAADKYLLNPNNLDADGEWEFIDYEKTDSEVYSSFLAFLVDSEKVYRTSISEMDSEEYFDPFND